jgi:hypothetical protein
MAEADARPTLGVRPLAVSADARALLARGVPRLRAVHRHGASLAIAGVDEDIYLSAPGTGLLPIHVVVRRRDLSRIIDAARACTKGANPPSLSLGIELCAVRTFATRLVPDPVGMRSERALGNIGALARWLRAQPEPLGLGLPADALLAPGGAAQQWVAALRENSPASEQALLALIGRGAGSTPAGDDFLIGMQAHAWACAGAEAPLVALLRALDQRLPRLTTSASVSYLRAATRGEFGSHLTVLVRSLAQVPRTRALALAARVAGHGVSSGLDTLAGFIAASEADDLGYRPRI